MVGHLGFSETVLADDLVVRNGIFYKKFTVVPFIGEVNGHQNGTIINGKRDGFWESYYDNGQLNWKGNYKMIAWTVPGNIIMTTGSYHIKVIMKLASKRGYLNIFKKMENLKKRSVGKTEEEFLNKRLLSNSVIFLLIA